jgi:thiol-disulfide isomerase/thioredoxin
MTNEPVKPVIVELFWASWCGACIDFHPVWEQLKKIFENNPSVKLIDYVDVSNGTRRADEKNIKISSNPKKIKEDENMIRKRGIRGFPTIKIDDKDYDETREVKPLMKAIEDKIDNNKPKKQSGGSFWKKKYENEKIKYFMLKKKLKI